MGSTSVPVGIADNRSVYYIGWNNLAIPLPAGVPLELSIQAMVPFGSNTEVRMFSSNIIGTNTLVATGCDNCVQSNEVVDFPFALRIMGD